MLDSLGQFITNEGLDCCDSTSVFTSDDLAQAGERKSLNRCRFTFDADPTTSHLVRYRNSRARAKKTIQDDIARARCDLEDSTNKAFWLRSGEKVGGRCIWEESLQFRLCLAVMSRIIEIDPE